MNVININKEVIKMSRHDEIEEDDGFSDFLRQLLELEHLEGTTAGITKLVIDKGEDALSDKQRFVFKRDVLDVFAVEACEICGNEIPWSEMYEAHDNGGVCGYCTHMMEKED